MNMISTPSGPPGRLKAPTRAPRAFDQLIRVVIGSPDHRSGDWSLSSSWPSHVVCRRIRRPSSSISPQSASGQDAERNAASSAPTCRRSGPSGAGSPATGRSSQKPYATGIVVRPRCRRMSVTARCWLAGFWELSSSASPFPAPNRKRSGGPSSRSPATVPAGHAEPRVAETRISLGISSLQTKKPITSPRGVTSEQVGKTGGSSAAAACIATRKSALITMAASRRVEASDIPRPGKPRSARSGGRSSSRGASAGRSGSAGRWPSPRRR